MKARTTYTLFFLLLITSPISAQSAMPNSISFTRADSLRGELTPLRTCYDVLKYDLNVDVNIEAKSIKGYNTIRFEAKETFKTLQIDLFENMKINAILFHEDSLAFSREFNAVFISFEEVIPKGVIDSFTVYYSGNPRIAVNAPWDGGFSWKKDSKGNPWIGVSCQHLGASCWWPCKDHQSDEPSEMDLHFTVPSSLKAIANGRLLKTEKAKLNKTKYSWHISNPINTYCVTLNIGDYVHFNDYFKTNKSNILDLDYYVLPKHYRKAKKHFKQVKPMMEAYYNYFGQYPFINDGYKLVETPYLGMEHQGAIAYGNKYKTGYLGHDLSGAGFKFDYIIIHETAHEWWGNNVTSNDIADMWIHEGFGTYTEALYVEYIHGYNGYLKYINGMKRRVDNTEPIIGHYDVNHVGSGDMYNKGALMIHTIRNIIDKDSLFFAIIKEIQHTYKHGNVNTADIENLFSKRSGLDLSPVFNRYLRQTAIPNLIYRTIETSEGLKISYRYATDDYFSMPIKIRYGNNQLRFIEPSNKWQALIIKNTSEEQFSVATDLFYLNVNKVQ